jgi:hypothetical protein
MKMDRRLLLGVLFLLPANAAADEAPASGKVTLTVRETAGIRRFGYPVHVVLPLGRPVREADRFRLLENGRAIAAQFRPIRTDEAASGVHLDFNVSPGPLEKHTYTVEYGPDVTPGPEPKGGLKVETDEETITVAHPESLAFVVPRDLLGLLRKVGIKESDYVKASARGLLLRTTDHVDHRVGDTGDERAAVKVMRSGPLAVGLRCESVTKLPGGRRVSSVVTMEFPRSKSWVHISWVVSDPKKDIEALGAEFQLNIPVAPVLVDFGAGSYVYATLRKNEMASLRAGRLDPAKADRPAWETLLGPAGAPRPYVVATPEERRRAEGWAHVMDKQRCTAVAVEGFADNYQESELTADTQGRLRIWRRFGIDDNPAAPRVAGLSFWLHFVGMPVQVGAATSPQAMLTPLRVEVRPAPR